MEYNDYEFEFKGDIYYLSNYVGKNKNLVLPSSFVYEGKDITSYEIKNFAFNNGDFESVIIPSAVTKIGRNAFSNNLSLENVILTNGLYEIETEAFLNCEKIKEIVIPSSVEKIGCFSFMGCNSLDIVHLGKNIKEIGKQAFPFIKKFYFDGNIKDWFSIKFNGENYNPINQKTEFYFKNLNNDFELLTIIEMPNNISVIDSYQFCNFPKIEKVIINNNIKEIKPNAFFGCKISEIINLSDLIITPGSADNGEIARYTKIVKRSLFDDSYFVYNDFSFKFQNEKLVLLGCHKDYNCLELPASVVFNDKTYSNYEIEKKAFLGNDNIEEVIVPKSVTKIGESAFCECISLKKIILSDGIEKIDDFAFAHCGDLKEVIVPGTLKKIGNVFTETHIKKLVLLAGIEEISKDAFCECEIEEIELPGSIKKITSGLFFNQEYLWSVMINEGLEEIGDEAFINCKNLMFVYLPKSIEKIGKEAFYDCDKLESINYSGTIDEWLKIRFSACFDREITVAVINDNYESEEYFFDIDALESDEESEDPYNLSGLSLESIDKEGVSLCRWGNYDDGIKYLLYAAGKDYLPAIVNLGQAYNEFGDYVNAYKWTKKGAELNHPIAISNLSMLYRKGRGTNCNVMEAVKWAMKLIDLGELDDAYNSIICAYFYPCDKSQINRELGIKYAVEGASLIMNNNPDPKKGDDCITVFQLAYIYSNDELFGYNYLQAIKYYDYCVKCGFDRAMYNEAKILAYDLSNEDRNVEKAIELLNMAAEYGNGDAWVELGYMYQEGELVEKNITFAKYCYKNAINSNSCYQLYDDAVKKLEELEKNN